jgi:hypothetical protein
MSGKRNTPWRRTVAAYDVLRGRPPGPAYGLLIGLPMVASAGGFLIGLGMDAAVNRRHAARQGSTDPGRVTGPVPVPSTVRHDV